MYANKKLLTVVRDRVASELENLSYSYGSLFADINVDDTNDFFIISKCPGYSGALRHSVGVFSLYLGRSIFVCLGRWMNLC